MDNKITIFGSRNKISNILQESLLKDGYNVNVIGSDIIDFSDIALENLVEELDFQQDYYVFTSGVLHAKRINQQSTREILDSISINLISIVRICDCLLEKNPNAKIIIIGSESGDKGSFDTTYFLSKAALSKYVEERCISNLGQQLLLVSPSVIEDSGMTARRKDTHNVNLNKQNHPKKRLLESLEVADFILFLINRRLDYLTNTEIKINGGKFSRMKY
ncbi:SDR family oxidoreductase [Vibrio sp. SG41-7]|uniref:SDR family oxidoreductase n=1 Tax=Vibrio sp. SG41-7 TaxID=2760973 RepID=UPI00160475F6|nr:SDR family oxidoreductase [Vibrio sp. SG41-7]MBB1464844.1 SDR family oxidoreductase [Vibrio sp. SG41-7]